MADTFEELALLTDTQAQAVLNRIIEGYAARNPALPISDENQLSGILTTIGEATEESVSPQIDSRLSDPAAAQRFVLVEMARNPTSRVFVTGALQANRKVLFEPITTALVMAGIVFILETEFDVKVRRKDGKTDYEVHVGKKPTDKSILKKFFGLF